MSLFLINHVPLQQCTFLKQICITMFLDRVGGDPQFSVHASYHGVTLLQILLSRRYPCSANFGPCKYSFVIHINSFPIICVSEVCVSFVPVSCIASCSQFDFIPLAFYCDTRKLKEGL
jgi:hypothetical protein